MKLIVMNNLKRCILAPDGVLDYFVSTSSALTYCSYTPKESRNKFLTDSIHSLVASLQQRQEEIFSSNNSIILNYEILRDIFNRELSPINSTAELHGIALSGQLLAGENRGFEIDVPSIGYSFFVSGSLAYQTNSNLICTGIKVENGMITEKVQSLSTSYIERAFQKPMLSDVVASLFTENLVSKRIPGIGEVYEVTTGAYNAGVYDIGTQGLTPSVQYSYLDDLKVNELMSNINDMYAILVESSSVVVPGLSAALKAKSSGVTELSSRRPFFISRSGNLGIDPFITARAEVSRVEALSEFKSDDEILALSTNLTECAKLSGEMKMFDEEISEIASDGIMLYDEVTSVSDFIKNSVDGTVFRSLNNTFASRVEGISPSDNVGKYKDIKFTTESQVSLADWTGVENMVEDALESLKTREEHFLTLLSSSSFENINEKLEELNATYDLQLRTLSQTLAKQSQLNAKATAMLENIALILNYPVVMGKYGQSLGVISDYITISYDSKKDYYSITFDTQAMYQKALSKAMVSTDVRYSWNLHRCNNGDVDVLAGYDGSEHSKVSMGVSGSIEQLDQARSGPMIIVFDSITSKSLASFYKMPTSSIGFYQSNRKTVKDGSKVIEVVPDTYVTVPSGILASNFGAAVKGLLEVLYNHEAIKASMSIESTVREFRTVLKNVLDKIELYRDIVAEYTQYSRSLGMVKRMQEYYAQVQTIDYSKLSHNKMAFSEGDVFSDYDLINANQVLAAHQCELIKEFTDEDADLLQAKQQEVLAVSRESAELDRKYNLANDAVAYRIAASGNRLEQFIIPENVKNEMMVEDIWSETVEAGDAQKVFIEKMDASSILIVPPAKELVVTCEVYKPKVTENMSRHPNYLKHQELVKRLASLNSELKEIQKREMTNLYADKKLVEEGEVLLTHGNITSRWDLADGELKLKTISYSVPVSGKTINLYGGFIAIRALLSILDKYDVSTTILSRIRIQIARAFGFASVNNLKNALADLEAGDLTNREMFILKNVIKRPSADLNQEDFILSSALFGCAVSELCYSRLLLAEGKTSSELVSPAAYTLFKEII